MNQTTHYQLNQWEPSDQVRRTDFNADNAKLDAALAGLEGARRSDLLGTYTFPAGGTALSLDLTKFDLSKYVSLEVRLSRLTAAQSTGVSFTLNGLRDIYHNTRNGSRLVDYPGTVSLVEVGSNLSRGGGVLLIHLDGSSLAGQCWSTYTVPYNSFSNIYAYPYIDDWGVHPNQLAPDQLTSIKVAPGGTLTGGKVFLIGNRF